MGRRLVYLITASLCFSVCATRVEQSDKKIKLQYPAGKEPKRGLAEEIVLGNRPIADDGNDSGAADDEPLKNRRALQSGDLLTPPELLPLVKRLIAKVDTRKPGDGTGIISSATSPEKLAETLFKAFFRKERRIAEITKYDIAGLDALQALALDGEGIHQNLKLVNVDGGRCYIDDVLANNGVVRNNMCYANGPAPRKSVYRLLTKSTEFDSPDENMIPKQRKRREAGVANKAKPKTRVALINKLKKKRNLVVAPGRKHSNNTQSSKTQDHIGDIKAATAHPIKDVPIRKKANLKGCRWRFECTNQKDLDTCRLKTFCPGRTDGQAATDVKEQRSLQRVRRMIGISAVDEEVEKILEARSLRLRPANTLKKISELPPESLSQYIYNLIRRQEKRSKGIVKVRAKYDHENDISDESDEEDENEDDKATNKGDTNMKINVKGHTGSPIPRMKVL